MSDREERLQWFKTVILPHEAQVRSRLRRVCPPGFDIENLVAESLVRAYTAKAFERITAGRGYLMTIARNLLLDAARRDTIVSLDFMAELDLLRSEESLEGQLLARDELRRLHAVVETLPPQCRRVFLLRRVYDYSPGEIADRLVLSVSTVEKHLSKAILLVAQGLAKYEDGRSGRADGNAGRTEARRGAGGGLLRPVDRRR